MIWCANKKGLGMAKIINFNQAKKTIAKIKKEKRSSENRAKFGQQKSVKKLITDKKKKTDKHLNQHIIENTIDNETP